MQKITSFLWFEKEAGEVALFYTSIFKNSKIKNITTLQDTPSGKVEVASVELLGQEFTILAAGPMFRFNPTVSFMVTCATKEDVDILWEKLSRGGTTMMPLGQYPFSERYGWTQDRYGLSWQVIFSGHHGASEKIVPILMFVEKQAGRAEEAIHFYASVFPHSEVGGIVRYEKEDQPDREGTVKHASFSLEGQEFAAMDSARVHNFAFNEATSFVVNCENQQDIDYFWGKLSADPNAEQCGWLKDQFGLSWQIVPTALIKMLQDKDREKVARVTQAFLKMKKFDIASLQQAYNGE